MLILSNEARDENNRMSSEEVRDVLFIIELLKEHLGQRYEEDGWEDKTAEIFKRPACHLVNSI